MDIKEVKRLHGLGFAIHWLRPKSKLPLENNWQLGPRKTLTELRATYKKGMNVGVRTGKASEIGKDFCLYLLDVDVKSEDPKHADEAYKIVEAFTGKKIEELSRVASGRGGASLHIYMKAEGTHPSFNIARSKEIVKVFMPSVKPGTKEVEFLSQAEVDEGFRMRAAFEIDFYGTGKQAVLPPSIHPDSGREYTWLKPVASAADLVEIAVDRIQKPTVERTRTFGGFKTVDLAALSINHKTRALIEKMEGLDDFNNDRSAALFSVINVLVLARLSRDEIISILIDPANAISEVAYSRQSTEDGAARWLGSQIDKCSSEVSVEAKFSDGVSLEGLDWGTFDDPKHIEKKGKEIYAEGWEVDLDRGKDGVSIKTTLKNTALILRMAGKSDDWLFYNELKDTPVFMKRPPWRKDGTDKAWVDRTVYDQDVTDFMFWLNRAHKYFCNDNMAEKTIDHVSRRQRFHPIRERLELLKWDGVSRIGNWLETYMRADVSRFAPYVHAVGKKMLVAAVARVFEPGVKFDSVLILEGEQGIGKSTALSILGEPWFCDNIGDVTNKDSVAQIQGKWIIEIPELAAMYRAEANALKDFISRRDDRARLAYARSVKEFPRQCVFVGTTNESEYLKDETGNRRYWPVYVNKVDMDSLTDDVDQLWAEAVVEYKLGEEKLYLDDPKIIEMHKKVALAKMIVDPFDELVSDLVDDLKKAPEGNREGFERVYNPINKQIKTRFEALCIEICGASLSKMDRTRQTRLGASLRRYGFKKASDGKKYWYLNL